MTAVEQIIPHFPPAFIKDNGRALDWGHSNIIAYASGCSMHLTSVDSASKRLNRLCSVSVSPYNITCVKMHPKLRVVAIGDDHGRAFLWDIDQRRYIATAKPVHQNDKCLAMAWKDDLLLILTQTSHLFALSYTPGSDSTESLKNFTEVWNVSLPGNYDRFSIDPHFGDYVLFNSSSSSFCIFKFSSPKVKPESYFDSVEISSNEEIEDVQWSLHLPGYIFIVLAGEIMFFHMESRSIIPLVSQRVTSSSYLFILQLENDYSKFLVFHKNGAISLFAAKPVLSFYLAKDFQPKQASGVIVSCAASPTRDDLVALYYDTLGIALMDFNSMEIIAIDPIFPSSITCFDSDGTVFAYGTSEGFVILGNLFEPSETKRFSVSSSAVTFISFDSALSRIYWQTESELGVVDIAGRCVNRFTSRATSIIRCFGSRRGCLILQRDSRVLGVFVDGKERPLLLNADLVDISIDENVSTPSSGCFCALLKNQEIRYYSYNGAKIINTSGLKPRGLESEALCFAIRGSKIVTGFSNGILLFFDTDSKTVSLVQTGLSSLHSLKFSSSALFGMSGEGTLFRYDTTLQQCPYAVSKFQLVNEGLLLVETSDKVVRFMQAEEWKAVQSVTKYLPAPSEDELLKKYIEDQRNGAFGFFSCEAKDAWTLLRGQNSLRLQAVAGIGKSGFLEKVNCELFDRVQMDTPEFTQLKLAALMFADKFDDAAALIASSDVNSTEYMQNSLLAACLLANGGGEKVEVHLKSCALTLLEAGKINEAALLFRLGRLDVQAVNYFIDYGHSDIAMRFVRSCLTQVEKRAVLFKFGCQMVQQSRIAESITFFAGVGEYHAVLYVLVLLGQITDAYFIMKHLQKEGGPKPLTEDLQRLLPEITPLDSLCVLIEKQFQTVLQRLGMEEKKQQ